MAQVPLVADNQVEIVRVFDAPREMVFRAWASADALMRWFAPRGCTLAFCELDFRKGGALRQCIRTPDGKECWCRGEYREIVVPERIVYSLAIADACGNLVGPKDVGMDPEWPTETVVTVTLAEEAGKTRLKLHQTVSEALAKRTGAHPSWLQMLDRLGEELAGATA